MRLSGPPVDDERAAVGLAVELERRRARLVAQRQLQVQLDELAGHEVLGPGLERPRLAAGVHDPKRLGRADLHGRPALASSTRTGRAGTTLTSVPGVVVRQDPPVAPARVRVAVGAVLAHPDTVAPAAAVDDEERAGIRLGNHGERRHDAREVGDASGRLSVPPVSGELASPEWRSGGSWWRIAARSPSGSSARAASSGSGPSP